MEEGRKKQRMTRYVWVSLGIVLIITLILLGVGKIKNGARNTVTDEDSLAVLTMTPGVTTSPDVINTPTPEPTAAPTPTLSPTPTATPTPTLSPTPTATPTPALDMSLFSSSETIPFISIVTEGEAPIISRENYLNCEVTVGNTDEAYEMRDVQAGVRVRGNSSAYYGDVEKILTKQVPYRIKFEKKQNMLGLNDGAECKSWVLLRGHEKELVRDEIAFRLGTLFLGERYFSSDSQLVHLYVNGEFKGVYVLCEQPQINKYRITVNEPEEGENGTDVGYLLEIDNAVDAEDNPYFRMSYDDVVLTDVHGVKQQITYANYSVKSDTMSEKQVEFISSYMRNMFRLVYEACVNDNYLGFDGEYNLVPASYDNCKDTIEAVMDMDSVVAMYLVFEIMRDRDGGEGSFYMCVDFSEDSVYPKLTFLCPWDFSWTCQGDATGRYYASGFDDQSFVDVYGDRSNPWFILLGGEDWFMDLVREKWSGLQKETGAVYACIDAERQYLEAYEEDLNRKRSGVVNAAHDILDWIERRVKWLDEEWLQ